MLLLLAFAHEQQYMRKKQCRRENPESPSVQSFTKPCALTCHILPQPAKSTADSLQTSDLALQTFLSRSFSESFPTGLSQSHFSRLLIPRSLIHSLTRRVCTNLSFKGILTNQADACAKLRKNPQVEATPPEQAHDHQKPKMFSGMLVLAL